MQEIKTQASHEIREALAQSIADALEGAAEDLRVEAAEQVAWLMADFEFISEIRATAKRAILAGVEHVCRRAGVQVGEKMVSRAISRRLSRGDPS